MGYPDFPPVTPLLARLSKVVFGGSLAGFRVLAGLAALCSPMLLGANAMFQTVTFDQLAWLAVLYLFARLLRTGEPRWWLAVGAAVGAGLETKFTMFTLALGIAVGMLATPARRDLRTPWPWLGAGIALLLLAAGSVWARDRLPPSERERAAIVTGNYGEAGAIDQYRPRLGLPPATSGHNGYWFWAGDGRALRWWRSGSRSSCWPALRRFG